MHDSKLQDQDKAKTRQRSSKIETETILWDAKTDTEIKILGLRLYKTETLRNLFHTVEQKNA